MTGFSLHGVTSTLALWIEHLVIWLQEPLGLLVSLLTILSFVLERSFSTKKKCLQPYFCVILSEWGTFAMIGSTESTSGRNV